MKPRIEAAQSRASSTQASADERDQTYDTFSGGLRTGT
jgi:hypothetical protein